MTTGTAMGTATGTVRTVEDADVEMEIIVVTATETALVTTM